MITAKVICCDFDCGGKKGRERPVCQGVRATRMNNNGGIAGIKRLINKLICCNLINAKSSEGAVLLFVHKVVLFVYTSNDE